MDFRTGPPLQLGSRSARLWTYVTLELSLTKQNPLSPQEYLYSMGQNGGGELGRNQTSTSLGLGLIEGLEDIKQIVSGYRFSIALQGNFSPCPC